MKVFGFFTVFISCCIIAYTDKTDLLQYINVLTDLNSVLEKELDAQEKTFAGILKADAAATKTRRQGCLTGDRPAIVFDARLSTEVTPLGNNQIIVYDNLITNTGNAYDQFTGIFRAPQYGVYQFIATMWSIDSHYIDFEMVKNGQNICRGSTTTVNETMGICAAVVELQVGDHVWMRHAGTGGDYAHGLSYPVFAGHVIS